MNEHYEVVELGRRELVPGLREQSCHLDFEPKDEDYMTVWDVPEYLPESRPHYC